MPRRPQTVIRSGAPEDVLALIAHTLGFWPEESLVLVSLRGPRRRSGLVLRVDLADLPPGEGAPPGRGAALGDAARELVAPLVADGAGAALAVVLSRCGGPRPEHAALVTALAAAAADLRVDLLEVALVDGDRLHSLTCSRPCCPPGGRPLGDVLASVVGTEMVASGSVVARDRAAVVTALFRGVTPARQDVTDEVARLVRELETTDATGSADDPEASSDPGPDTAAAALRAWWAAVEQVLAATGRGCPSEEAAAAALDPPRAAVLLVAVGHLHVRDAVLAGVVPGAREVLCAAPAGAGAGELRRRVAVAVASMADAPDAGDPDVLEASEALGRRLAQVAPPELRARPLAVLAHWAWWRGSTVEATVLAKEALRGDPRHSLASLVLQMATSAVPPDWVRPGGAPGRGGGGRGGAGQGGRGRGGASARSLPRTAARGQRRP